LAADERRAPALRVADDGRIVGVGRVEAVAVDLHEDEDDPVERQPRPDPDRADGIARPRDDRRLGARRLAPPLALDQARTRAGGAVEWLKRADLGPAAERVGGVDDPDQ